MKITQFPAACLFITMVAIANAQSNMVLHADLGNKTTKLTAEFIGGTQYSNSLVVYGDISREAIKYEVNDGYVTVQDHPEQKLLLEQGSLVYGINGRKIQFEIEDDYEVTNKQFYSCKLDQKNLFGIFYNPPSSIRQDCFKVKLYLKPDESMDNNISSNDEQEVSVEQI